MITVDEEYLVDATGTRKAVVLPLSTWEQIKEALDELEDIRAYDAAKSGDSDPIPFEQALRAIETGEI